VLRLLLQEQRRAGTGQCCRWLAVAVQQGGVGLQGVWLPRIARQPSRLGSSRQRLWIYRWCRRRPQPQRLLQHAGTKTGADRKPSVGRQWLGGVRQRGCKWLAEQRGRSQGCR
jgi:hypothetical protein